MATPDQIETFSAIFRDHGLDAAIDAIRRPTPAACSPLLRRVCAAMEVTPQQLLHGGRGRAMSDVRHIAAWVCRQATGASYPVVGQALGGMHHTSVMHAVRRVDRTPRLRERAEKVIATIQGGRS